MRTPFAYSFASWSKAMPKQAVTQKLYCKMRQKLVQLGQAQPGLRGITALWAMGTIRNWDHNHQDSLRNKNDKSCLPTLSCPPRLELKHYGMKPTEHLCPTGQENVHVSWLPHSWQCLMLQIPHVALHLNESPSCGKSGSAVSFPSKHR